MLNIVLFSIKMTPNLFSTTLENDMDMLIEELKKEYSKILHLIGILLPIYGIGHLL